MTIPRNLYREHKCLSSWAILTAYRGSIAHGMYMPSSDPLSVDDKDVMTICVPPEEYYLGLRQFGSRGTKEIVQDEWDIVVYEARKAIGLLAKGNPNVLSLLWLKDEHYIKRTHAAEELLESKRLFSGKHVYISFVGYAKSQLHRMTHGEFRGRMGTKRKELVKRFGYDPKNAAHLIRLLRMGIEFLSTGQLNVLRHDAQELLEIKRGEWKLEQVKAEADRLFKLAELAHIHSPLPATPNMEMINRVCVNVVRAAWR